MKTFILFCWLAVLVLTVLTVLELAGFSVIPDSFWNEGRSVSIEATEIDSEIMDVEAETDSGRHIKISTEFLYPATDQLIGFSAKNRDGIIEYLQCRELLYGALEEGKPKLRIVLKDWGGSEDAADDSVVAIYQTYADIPYHSVKVDCPKSKYPIRECWFIKYEEE